MSRLPKSKQVDLSKVYPLTDDLTEEQQKRREAVQSYKKTHKGEQDELTIKEFIRQQEEEYNRIAVNPDKFNEVVPIGSRVAYITNHNKEMKAYQRGKPRIGGVLMRKTPEFIVLRNFQSNISWSVQIRFVERFYFSGHNKVEIPEQVAEKATPIIASKPSNFPIYYKGHLIKYEPSKFKQDRFMRGKAYKDAVELIDKAL